ncbi:MAG: hypothetical protein Q8R26_00765 [bacterium]|nr:hypothetical protein [bacterium]
MELKATKGKKFADGIRQKGLVIDLSAVNRARMAVKEEAESSEPEAEEELGVFPVREYEDPGIIVTSEEEKIEPVIPEIRDTTGRFRGGLKLPKVRLPHKTYIWGGLGATLVLFVLLTFSFASFTVSFKPKQEPLSLPSTMTALDVSVSQVMVDKKVIPAELLELSKKTVKDFTATGRKVIEDRAKGKVRIYNSFSSSPQKLVSSTRFVSDSGLLYRLPETINIPGASIEEGKIIPRYVETSLVADQAGESYNMEKEITLKIPGFKGGPKYETFYATAPNGFLGGFKGEAKVISKDDLKKSQEETSKLAYEEMKNEISKKIPPGFQTIEGLREIQVLKVVAPKENSKADQFSVEVQTRGKVMVFKKEDGDHLLKELIIKKDSSVEYIDGSAVAKYQAQNTDFEKGKSMVFLEGGIKVASKVDERDLLSMIKGQKERAVQEFLKSRTELASFNMSLFPPWRTSVPKSENKIKLIKEKP